MCGPTGVGKTDISIGLAERLGCPILNADSRQIYKEIPIGTAAPTAQEQARVPHYFVGIKSITEDYNAGAYERDAMTLLNSLFAERDILVMAGGAMLYIDAVCNGLDNIPDVPRDTRLQLTETYRTNGLEWLQGEVHRLDPEYYSAMADPQNPQRLLHALEVCIASGMPYSHFRSGEKKTREFNIIKIGLTRPRDILYSRINSRVDTMLQNGLEEEARKVSPLRHLNGLQTVGYKEMFDYFEGKISQDEARHLIQQNSRHYAKRQLTWFRRDKDITWIDIDHTSTEQAIRDILETATDKHI